MTPTDSLDYKKRNPVIASKFKNSKAISRMALVSVTVPFATAPTSLSDDNTDELEVCLKPVKLTLGEGVFFSTEDPFSTFVIPQQNNNQMFDPYFWLLYKLQNSNMNTTLHQFSTFTHNHQDLFALHKFVCCGQHRFFTCQKNHLDLKGFIHVYPRLVNEDLVRYISCSAFNILDKLEQSGWSVQIKDLALGLQFWRTSKEEFALRFSRIS